MAPRHFLGLFMIHWFKLFVLDKIIRFAQGKLLRLGIKKINIFCSALYFS